MFQFIRRPVRRAAGYEDTISVFENVLSSRTVFEPSESPRYGYGLLLLMVSCGD